jgi:cyclophilin family peptidyl-prolyl cis-trans isomerase
MSNPRVFLDISIENVEIGRIMIELFSSVVPKTAQNFLSLCVGTNGKHYKNSDFHRIIKDFMIQGGDFTNNDGTGGCSIYENTFFEDENFQLKHDQAMLLSMANRGPGTNGSQFFITSQATPHLDGKHVVFGRVVKGQDIFRTMENVRCDENDKPLKRVWISHCGELERVLKAPVIVSEQQESEKSEMDEESEGDSNPYVIGVAPPPEADVPNRFLNDAVRKPIDYKMPSRSKNATDSRGRKIKGRGNLVKTIIHIEI